MRENALHERLSANMQGFAGVASAELSRTRSFLCQISQAVAPNNRRLFREKLLTGAARGVIFDPVNYRNWSRIARRSEASAKPVLCGQPQAAFGSRSAMLQVGQGTRQVERRHAASFLPSLPNGLYRAGPPG